MNVQPTSWAPVMTHRPFAAARFTRQRTAGFVIPSAIFLVVILALLAAFLVRLSSSQSATSTQDIQGTRAYHAARAGLELALFGVTDPLGRSLTNGILPPIGGGANVWPNHPACPANMNLNIEGFAVFVRCALANPVYPGLWPDSTIREGIGPCTTNEAAQSVQGPWYQYPTPACAARSIQVYILTATASTAGVNPGNPAFIEREITTTVSHCRSKEAAIGYTCP